MFNAALAVEALQTATNQTGPYFQHALPLLFNDLVQRHVAIGWKPNFNFSKQLNSPAWAAAKGVRTFRMARARAIIAALPLDFFSLTSIPCRQQQFHHEFSACIIGDIRRHHDIILLEILLRVFIHHSANRAPLAQPVPALRLKCGLFRRLLLRRLLSRSRYRGIGLHGLCYWFLGLRLGLFRQFLRNDFGFRCFIPAVPRCRGFSTCTGTGSGERPRPP